MITIKAYANSDHAYIVWRPSKPIAKCLGFALYRKPKGGAAKAMDSFVGPETEKNVPSGTHRPSTTWPIQKYLWSDYQAPVGTPVQYQVIAMCGDSFATMKPGETSAWSAAVTLNADVSAAIQPLFNRGVVSTQWVARQLKANKGKSLKQLVQTPEGQTTPVRDFLGGALKAQFLALLAERHKAGAHLYASLYELKDPEVLPALKAFGARAHIVLANGTHASKKPPEGAAAGAKATPADENADARKALKAAHAELHNRMVTGSHFAHHKFIVFTDPRKPDKAQMVWTGSTNLTYGGLCTQANNGILIRDAATADRYLQQWCTLVDSGNAYPAALVKAGAKAHVSKVGKATVTSWFAPNPGIGKKPTKGYADHPDLKAARALLQGAQQGVLFLVFNPGPRGTLLNDILDLVDQKGDKLFIRGVANQDPGGKQPILFVHDGKQQRGPAEIVLPSAVSVPPSLSKTDKAAAEALNQWVKLVSNYWQQESSGLGMVRVHSKVILVDPFGKHPVVMTGSHNLGPKASEVNDDNLVIIENDPETAAAYAVNIMTIYDQYRWRFQQVQAAKKGQTLNQWHGTTAPWDKDGGYLKAKAGEIAFWM